MRKWLLVQAIVFLFFIFQAPLAFAAPICTNLTSDLSYGVSSLQVLSLQNFLFAQGYLKVTPNSTFGPATLAAVKAFQLANRISATGYVGALTRVAVSAISCATPQTQTTTISTVPVSAIAPTVSSNIIAPLGSAVLSIGQTYNIAWNSTSNQGYSVILEDSTGLSQGFITPNSQMGSYSWQVGTVLSGATDSYTTVPTGTYRIHLRSVSGGAPDMYSGQFTIVAPPLTVSGIMPTTLSASKNPTIVMYGSGFNSSSRLTVDGYYNWSANILYASPDGTVIVFSLPVSVSTGLHVFDISNAYGSLASSPAVTVTQ